MEFKITKSRFQTELLKVVRDVGKCRNLTPASDKIANFYKISVGDKHLNDIKREDYMNLTSNFKIHDRIKKNA